MGEKSVRCFVGIALDAATVAPVQQALSTLQAEPWAKHVRWVETRNWHLTLAFLGEQSSPWLDLLHTQLLQSMRTFKPSSAPVPGVQSRWISGFPDASSRIVALEFHRSPMLLELKSVLDAVLLHLQFSPETRDFRAHVTLGRVKREQQVHFDPVLCDVTVPLQQLVLFQSIQTAHGSEYDVLWSVPLPGCT